jgi:hypothetical protein
MKTFAILVLAAWISSPAAAAEPKPFTNGEIRLRVISGPQETEFRYLLRDGTMRIDHPGEIIPAPPVNLLDLASGNLTILHPHNGTWQRVPAAKLRPRQLGTSGLPDIGPRQAPGITPPGEAGHVPVVAAVPASPGPRPPDFPRPMPAIPPSDAFPVPSALSQELAIPFGRVPPMELKATPEQREIHGYPCTRHTLAIPREGVMSLWLAGPGLFPPFHLLEADLPDLPRSHDELAKVPALLRERDLFPLLAELKGGDRSPILHWKVTAITPSTGVDASLFLVPGGFQPLVPP